MTERERRLSEEEARRIWRRAAELQAEAARRLEERSRSLAHPGDAAQDEPGYALTDVRAAAVEAGIGGEFVGRALAELEGSASAPSGLADLVLGPEPRELVVSRVVEAPPDRVYRVLQRIVHAPPFEMALRDRRGGDPLAGGVLVFEVPPMMGASGFGYELRGHADVKEVLVSLQPVGEEGRRTEVTVRGPLDHARRLNTWVSGGLAAVGGGLLGAVAGALAAGAGAAAGLPGALLLWTVVLVGIVTFGLGTWVGAYLMRGIWRWGLGRGESALVRMLSAVGVNAEADEAEDEALPPPMAGG